MKKLFFVMSFLSCCHPAELKTDVKSNAHTGILIEDKEPVGVIPDDDCQQIDIGDKACNFRLTDQNGDTWDLYEHEGDVVLLDFSTVWCYPCQVAGHHTQTIQDQYQSEGFQFVTVLLEGSTAGEVPTDLEVDTWVTEHGVTTAPVLEGSKEKMIDPQTPGAVDVPGETGYLLNAYPTYIYIGRDLKFYAGHVGFSEDYIKQKIEEGL